MKFRKKPVVIEAVQYDGTFPLDFLCDQEHVRSSGDGDLLIETLEGAMRCNIGDWLIRGVEGELYPCKPHIFDATYELDGKVSEQVWVCPECGLSGMEGSTCTDCNPVEPDKWPERIPYVPAQRIQALERQVEVAREALRWYADETDHDDCCNDYGKRARAALETLQGEVE